MKGFEEKYSELQADMISICMEYVEDRAEKVYVIASCEENVISGSFFFRIHDTYVECHKVNDALKDGENRYDVSSGRMFKVLEVISEDISRMKKLCKEYNKDMPTEMKLIYDVGSGKFQAEYQYDLVYTHDDTKTANHIANEWFEEIQSKSL
jgi:hypothetical protein